MRPSLGGAYTSSREHLHSIKEKHPLHRNYLECRIKSNLSKPHSACHATPHLKALMITSDNKPHRVLVVDDDANMRSALGRLFTYAKYDVELYESGTTFLELADLQAPGCVILDLTMPGIDGLEVQAALNKRQCHLPLIFLTGSAAIRNAVDAMRAGATDFLEKPFDNDNLLRRVEAALSDQAILRQTRDAHADVVQRVNDQDRGTASRRRSPRHEISREGEPDHEHDRARDDQGKRPVHGVRPRHNHTTFPQHQQAPSTHSFRIGCRIPSLSAISSSE